MKYWGSAKEKLFPTDDTSHFSMSFQAHTGKYLRWIALKSGKKTLMHSASIILPITRGLTTFMHYYFSRSPKTSSAFQSHNTELWTKGTEMWHGSCHFVKPQAFRMNLTDHCLKFHNCCYWVRWKLHWVGRVKRESISSLLMYLSQTSGHMKMERWYWAIQRCKLYKSLNLWWFQGERIKSEHFIFLNLQ